MKAGARGLQWGNRRPDTMDDYTSAIGQVAEPYVSHETGQWCVFPNFDEIDKYTGVNKARNFEVFRDILNDHGMGTRAKQFMMAAGKLQAICYKYEIERTMRTPQYAGFQLLALNDPHPTLCHRTHRQKPFVPSSKAASQHLSRSCL